MKEHVLARLSWRCRTLVRLLAADSSAERDQVATAEAGAVEPLVGAAVATLRDLSVNDEIQMAFAKPGAVKPLVRFLATDSSKERQAAVAAFGTCQ